MVLLPTNPQRILVIHVTRIGDTIMTTPSLRAIADAWPNARLTFLGHPKRAEVIEHLPFVHEVGRITKHSARLKGLLGKKHWDLGFVFGFDEALVRFALRSCAAVVAFEQKDARLNARLWRTEANPPPNSLHAVDRLLRLPRLAGATPARRSLEYHVTPEESAAALQRLRANGAPAGQGPIIGLVVESFPTKPYRDWDIAHFADLAAKLAAAYPTAYFLLLGGKMHANKIARLREVVGDRLAVLAGTLSLRETAAVMAQLDLYVGVDTGPTQLAGAIGIPMVALYHCKHPGSVYAPPENARVCVLEHPDQGDQCSEQSSMSKISVEQVFAAARSRLEQHRGHES